MSAFYPAIVLLCTGLYCASSMAADQADDPITESAPAVSNAANLPRGAILGRNVQAAQAIQLSADAKQLIDLTTPVEHFSALFIPANVAKPRGMVILLPGADESFDWPVVIGPLRRKLPDAGWHTLSINLPQLPSPILTDNKVLADITAEQIPVLAPEPIDVPEDIELMDDEELIEPEPEPEDEEPVEELATTEPPLDEENDDITPEPIQPAVIVIPEYPQRISNFLDAAIDYAQTLAVEEVVLIGHHEGAHWVLNYQNQHVARLPIRSALISPRNSELLDTSYEALIEASNQPIVDFYYKHNAIAHTAAQQRLAASRRANRQDYKQISLTTATGVRTLEQESLFRRVKGWLNKPVETHQ
ncbi:MAG: DUF3530 family protein [Pseudomonas sp.]|nr:DUF3530 family protein [Pseudomonas sp.]